MVLKKKKKKKEKDPRLEGAGSGLVQRGEKSNRAYTS